DAARPRRRGAPAPPPRVSVARAASREAAVIEVRAQDAPGLLHRIGLALETADVRLRSAHVSTLGANAVDTVYVTRPDGTPLAAEEAAMVAKRVEGLLAAD
ncbi:ACT domain-containing protein, partial [Streptomyces fuscigenes]|uniref:ACT domain-containing protein n=1 Tax=Streptomyces fuscigenes TaxID=1528880 RepID=UPI003558FF41|nr:[protein-PII] uridylyltransferase [Streptomyces fuscigenes]